MYETSPTRNGLSIEIQAIRDAVTLLSLDKCFWSDDQKARHVEMCRLVDSWVSNQR